MNDVANDVDDSLGELLALQRTAFLREGPPSLAQRRADLKKLRTAIVARKTDITDAMMADFGHRAPFESLMEPLSLVLGIDYLLGNLAKFMRPTRRHVAMSMRFGSARIEYQPLGVIGIRSEEHTSELKSLMRISYAVFCLKKKKHPTRNILYTT